MEETQISKMLTQFMRVRMQESALTHWGGVMVARWLSGQTRQLVFLVRLAHAGVRSVATVALWKPRARVFWTFRVRRLTLALRPGPTETGCWIRAISPSTLQPRRGPMIPITQRRQIILM